MIFDCAGFEWDDGNWHKSWLKHDINPFETEEIFFNTPLIVADDITHSALEKRNFALGQTDRGKLLMVVFTVRNKKIRIISARSMSRREKKIYHEKK